MTKISRDEILKLAKLSKLRLSEDEIVEYQKELSEILEYVSQLSKVDTKNLRPTSQVTGLENVTRKDEIIDYGVTPAELLKNAPATKDNQIKVKRVLN
jgi:aspartyl-tRNA(Asn)/glutamyl-tRNA(Gln) amidotransferase subunit C